VKPRGFGRLELAIALIAVTICGAVLFLAYGQGKHAGAAAERAAWQARELEQQQAYAGEIELLRKTKDAALEVLQGKLAAATDGYERKRQEAEREKAKNARFERDLRDGRIVLVDPGAGQAGRGERAAGTAAAGNCNGTTDGRGRLSPQLAEFLWSEAGRADRVIEELEEHLRLAQDVLTAYYELARSCAVNGSPKP